MCSRFEDIKVKTCRVATAEPSFPESLVGSEVVRGCVRLCLANQSLKMTLFFRFCFSVLCRNQNELDLGPPEGVNAHLCFLTLTKYV